MKESELSTMNQLNCDINKNDCNELRLLGANILNWIENIDEKVVVIISGDGAHTHKCDKDQAYKYNENAIVFDNFIDKWIIENGNSIYLDSASNILYDALSCGFYGYLILDGMINRWKRLNGSQSITSNLISKSLHPSYYSMLVASFQFNRIM